MPMNRIQISDQINAERAGELQRMRFESRMLNRLIDIACAINLFRELEQLKRQRALSRNHY